MKLVPIGASVGRAALLLVVLLPVSLLAAPTPYQLVVEKEGTTSGTVTDLDGRHEIDAEPSDNLIFAYPGMATQVVPVRGQTTSNLEMVANASLAKGSEAFAGVKLYEPAVTH